MEQSLVCDMVSYPAERVRCSSKSSCRGGDGEQVGTEGAQSSPSARTSTAIENQHIINFSTKEMVRSNTIPHHFPSISIKVLCETYIPYRTTIPVAHDAKEQVKHTLQIRYT